MGKKARFYVPGSVQHCTSCQTRLISNYDAGVPDSQFQAGFCMNTYLTPDQMRAIGELALFDPDPQETAEWRESF